MTDSLEVDTLEFAGSPGSPYSMKMLAYMRYRRIPYAFHIVPHGALKGYPTPRPVLFPTFFFKNEAGELEAKVDSTPIIRKLETEHEGRAALPENPALRFLHDLIEDYADEWMTKIMFHYRWADAGNAEYVAPMLMYWRDTRVDADAADEGASMFASRQIERLKYVGSNEVTAETIEASYLRVLDILDRVIAKQAYLFGSKPTAADFAVYGQMSQIAMIEPSSAKICQDKAPRIRCWLDHVADASGISADCDGWEVFETSTQTLRPFFEEIGRTYAPLVLANGKAAKAGKTSFETEIDGRRWMQDVFPYHVKCLMALRKSFAELPAESQTQVRGVLQGTGCDVFMGS
ncbi:glutathione S-transferase family protein [Flexibacterium corallicola]|uniref:glutathione S-transferase family protein n=1 Tax=Flexibacterium corallicola TaxID=3037259 RepID=UPI00286EDA07|nr:glutathione S-transferase family protein [Pseudovibrio sp. M1P-2-3]